MRDHLLLVDASGFAFRSFYTFPPMYRDSDGQPTGAVLGFMSMLWRMLGAAAADRPTHAAAVFDAPGKNFRHELFPKYKANRGPVRAIELTDQMPVMRHAAEGLGLNPIEREGFEADDVIATLAHRAHAAGMRTTIVSSDKDFAQLVVDDWIEIVDPMKKVRILSKDVVEKFGVEPSMVADVQALAGDAVDGIPGLPGCGLETAGKLIRRFGSVEAVIANRASVRFPMVKAELNRKADKLRVYLQLTTLRRDVPLACDWPALVAHPPMKSHLLRICRVLEAKPQAVFGFDIEHVRLVTRVEDPMLWYREELAAPGQRLPEDPQAGFYMRRLVKGGPLVAARIWRVPAPADGQDVLRCELGGRPVDPVAEWPRLAMKPIPHSEFLRMTGAAKHAFDNIPGSPLATPHRPIDRRAHAAVRNPRSKTS